MSKLMATCFTCIFVLLGTILFYDLPKQEAHLAALKIRVEALEADNLKLSQNDSTLAGVINTLYRRIRALEADTVQGRKK